MMSELGFLFLIVVLVYLVQCIYWVPPEAAVFALDFRGRGKWRRGGFTGNALKSEGFLAGPLPPLAPLTVQTWPSFALNPDAMAVLEASGQWKRLSWEQLSLTKAESKLRCNGTTIFHGSEGQVDGYFQLLEALQKADKSNRGSRIERWLKKTMRAESARRRLHVFSRRSRLLRILANLQLVFLFVAVPMAFSRFGPAILWRVILFLVVLQPLIALEFWSVYSKLFRPGGEAKFKATITILLSPVAAIRACDVIARDLFSAWHPLATAVATLPSPEFGPFAGEQLRRCRFGDHPDAWYRDAVAKAMECAIRKAGAQPDTLLRPAERESGCVVYCPRCLAQYVKSAAECSDCGFENLVAFAGGARPSRDPSQKAQ
jgi:hypothetical protein